MLWKNAKHKTFKKWSIANQLTFLYTTATLVILAIIAIIAYWVIQKVIITAETQFILDEVHIFQNVLRDYPHNLAMLHSEINAVPASRKDAAYHYFVRLIDQNGRLLAETPGTRQAAKDPIFPKLNLQYWQQNFIFWQTPNDNHFISITAPIQFDQNGNPEIIMQMMLDVSYSEEIVQLYYFWAFIILTALACIVILIGKFIAHKGLSSLYDLIDHTKQINIERLAERIETNFWPKELKPVGESFNTMLTRIETAFKRITESTTEIAHELRSPINNLMLATEVTLARSRESEEYKQVLTSNFEEYQRLAHIIDNILFLARAHNQLIQLKRNEIELNPFIKSICDFYEISAIEKGIRLSYQASGQLFADAVLLRRAISNLINNAINHTMSDGMIQVFAESQQNRIKLSVHDTGIGIDKQHLRWIFDRYYQANESKTTQSKGLGIGLSIVKSIVELHRGQIVVHSEPSVGTTVELYLPQ